MWFGEQAAVVMDTAYGESKKKETIACESFLYRSRNVTKHIQPLVDAMAISVRSR